MTAPAIQEPKCPKCVRGGAGPHPAYCTPEMRFWHKTRRVGACLEWQGASTPRGYGQMTIGRRRVYAHRMAYERTWGESTDGLVVMHTCDNPRCVRPVHLFIGTQKDNIHDMLRKGRAHIQPRKTHCIRGHAFTPENTGRGKRGTQVCRECNNARRRRAGGRGPYKRNVA